jgi:DMSO/TMAO reductase YedYZ molybdopterin-dependent catalytic subunit
MTTAWSAPSRLAPEAEGVSHDELALAGRNHSLLLEALRYDVTPPGLHYVLVHYDIPVLDVRSWRLTVDGAVTTPLSLDLEGLGRYEQVTQTVTMECAGNGRAHLSPRPVSQPWLEGAVGTAQWTGVRLADVLAAAGVRPDAVDVVLTGADHGIERGVEQDYARGLSLTDATAPEVLLAWAMNGAPLPPQHGFPLRVVVPGWYGMTSVKWLTSITVTTAPFEGFQNAVAYRDRADEDDPGVPVDRIAPRALMVPPGFPDFGSRRRVVDAGPVLLEGRAWSGRGPVTAVEVSTDGGVTWVAAVVDPALGPHAWARWTASWRAEPGDVEIVVRASDGEGSQPLEPRWNVQGMANNGVQRVPVRVR